MFRFRTTQQSPTRRTGSGFHFACSLFRSGDRHLFVNSTIFAKGLATRMDKQRRQHLTAAQDTRGGKFKATIKVKKSKP